MKQEIRIASIGNVDSAKTTTISVLANNKLDNGKGLARKYILKHPHESISGRTSSITQHYIESENSIIGFFDLAGHHKYFKTTVSGLNGGGLDYAMITIGSDRGVIGMTKEHLTVAIALNIPIFLVITKIDIAIQHKVDNIRRRLSNIFQHPLAGNKTLKFINDTNIDSILGNFSPNESYVPVFEVSNVTGQNIDILRRFISSLKKYKMFGNIENKNPIFKIDDTFKVDGLGIIISGQTQRGTINTHDVLYIGPFDGNFIPVIVKSIHNNFKQIIPRLHSDHSGCLNIRPMHTKKHTLTRQMIKRGAILIGEPLSCKKFDADVTILHHPTTIKPNYEPVIHCGSVRQTAKICNMDKILMRTGDQAKVTFEFKFKPEFVQLNNQIVFREGNTKGIGKITKIYE